MTQRDEIEITEPHLPEDFRLIIEQLGKIVEIYHELIMVWARPPMVYRSEEDKNGIDKAVVTKV